MADTREQILTQIVAILTTISGDRTGRNDDDLTGKPAVATVLFDGGETITDNPVARSPRGIPAVPKDFMHMTPEIMVILQAPTTTIGTLLNQYRVQLLPLILGDTTLASLVGANGEIRYTGCTVETQGGEAREGRMSLDFRFTYMLNVPALSN
jgi:hypothetical protein